MPVIGRTPSGRLGSVVRSIAYGTVRASSLDRIVPGTSVALWFNLTEDHFRFRHDSTDPFAIVSGVMLAGPEDRAKEVELSGGRCHVSVHLRLGVRFPFLPDLSAARNEFVPLVDLLGAAAVPARERVLECRTLRDRIRAVEQLLEEHLGDVLAPDRAVLAAARSLDRGFKVDEVADHVGLLPRTLRRRFIAQVGIGPKRFAMVRRIRRVVASLPSSEVDWAEVAASHGYSDQPHLVDEFQTLVGVTPTEYLLRRGAGGHHLSITPA